MNNIHVLTSFGLLLLGIASVTAAIFLFLTQIAPFSLKDLFFLFSIGLIEIYVVTTEYGNRHNL